jgi:two-component system LytT family response regulator
MLRALVIDDETPARQEMKYLLEQTNRVQVCGEASNVYEAVKLIKTIPVDVLFLDISMPGVSGIQLAESLTSHPNPPLIVFVTAYSAYALEAFNVNAIDYLVKPVSTDRLNVAIDKVITIRRESMAQGRDKPQRIPVSKGEKHVLLDIHDIVYIMAKDDYTILFTDEDHYLSTTSLTAFEEQLTPFRFFRTHRKYLVNLDWVLSIDHAPGAVLTLSLKDKNLSKIPVARRRVGELKYILAL